MHDLRKTAATLAVQQGATVREIMVMLGHTTPEVAMIYQSAAEQRLKDIATRMDDVFAAVQDVAAAAEDEDGRLGTGE